MATANAISTLEAPRALASLAVKLLAPFLPDGKTAERFLGVFTANIHSAHTRQSARPPAGRERVCKARRHFLFETERNVLGAVRPVLMDLEHGNCFYCGQAIRGEGRPYRSLHPVVQVPD